MKVLEVPAYVKLLSLLPWESWKGIATALLRSVIASNTALSDVAAVERLFAAIAPLLRDSATVVKPAATNANRLGLDDDDEVETKVVAVSPGFRDEQQLVARVMHLLRSDDSDEMLRMLAAARVHFISGGPQRIQFTLIPAIFTALALARRVFARERAVIAAAAAATAAAATAAAAVAATEAAGAEVAEVVGTAVGGGDVAVEATVATVTPPQFSSRKVFQYVMEVNMALAATQPEQALKMFLQSAQVTGRMIAIVAQFLLYIVSTEVDRANS
jgi:vacuolar protein sorting-associated protein 35